MEDLIDKIYFYSLYFILPAAITNLCYWGGYLAGKNNFTIIAIFLSLALTLSILFIALSIKK